MFNPLVAHPVSTKICKLSSTYKLSQLTLLVVMKTAPIAIGGTIAALAGTLTSYHRDIGTIGDFRKDFDHELGRLWAANDDLRKDINLFRKDINLEFGRLWVANEQLLVSHTEVRKNMQAINDTLTKTLKAQQDCAHQTTY